MDPNAASKLNRMIRKGRIWTALKVLCILVPIAGLFAFFWLDKKTTDSSTTYGVVENWSRTQRIKDGGRYLLQVRLSDNTIASATASTYGRPPVIGEKIEIVRLKTASGRVVYNWKNY